MIRLLLASQTGATGNRIEKLLQIGGIEAASAASADGVRARLTRDDFDMLVIEQSLFPERAIDFLTELRSLPEHPGVVVLAPEDDPRRRAELLASGCDAVLWLGLDDDTLGATLVSLARRRGDETLERLGAERAEKRSTLADFTSASSSMQHLLRMARRCVKGDSALLILGETGVGKERLARSIHSESARSRGPFITVNCGALPETLLETELFGHEEGAFTGAVRSRRGYFELAHRGTIFLDEIGEMPLHLQVKLLRVLEDKSIYRVGSEKPVRVDVRVMAATNRDLKREMESGRFRPDLYYRLAVVTLHAPPLRERRDDIPELARAFLETSRRKLVRPVTGFEPEAIQALVRHDWPGNVRELMNVVERAVLLAPGRNVRVDDLRASNQWEAEPTRTEMPPGDRRRRSLGEARRHVVARFEQEYLRHLLGETRGRIGETARLAGITERTLYTMMRRHGLRKEDFKSMTGDDAE
ncbi:MAG TPA: sigma-54 dependent transcriptional regulator [Vicinamibacteria bacterium]|nr:sigma-54 dependent transcriptional regulator [Vicinamibacteria bacterium]